MSDDSKCPFERLDAWVRDDQKHRSFELFSDTEPTLAYKAMAFSDSVHEWALGDTPREAAEALCRELGI